MDQRRQRSRRAWLYALALSLTIAAYLPAQSARGAQLTLACLDVARAVEACRAGAKAFTEATGHTVRVVSAESQNRVTLERYQALFGVASGRLDVVQFPLAWLYAIAEHLAPIESAVPEAAFIDAVADVGKVGELRLALAQHLAVTMLYLRSDVVARSPEDWQSLQDELAQAPTDSPAGLSVAGAGPSLFPFFLDWLASLSVPSLENREGVERALQVLEEGVGAVASRDIAGVTARAAVEDFAAGNSAGLLARSTRLGQLEASPIADRLGTTVRPAEPLEEGSAPLVATIWALGVSRHSRHSGPASELANFLVSPEIQRMNALQFRLAPTLEALYDDIEVTSANSLLAGLAARIANVQAVPVERYREGYLEMSDRVAEVVRNVIRDEIAPGEAARAIVSAARQARLRTE